MRALSEAATTEFQSVRFVLTDMDETLTYRGRLAAATYSALERLQAAGVRVIPVTAAPAGWCDQMARMWPVDGVIGENGGLYLERTSAGHGVVRRFWHPDESLAAISARLKTIAEAVIEKLPEARFAEDQPFRLTSIAFARTGDSAFDEQLVSALREAGADVTTNNLWVLGWLGGYDKLSMARRILAEQYGVDINRDRESILYSGDSTNDAPMFEFFKHTVGVSTVRQYLDQIPVPPRWITDGPGGAGFVEAAEAVISARGLADMRKPIHRKLEVTTHHWALISGRNPTDELSFPSERLQVIFNDTSTPWQDTVAHAHRESDEIYIVLEGQMVIAVNGELFNVAADEVLCVPSGTVHQLMRVEVPCRSLVLRSPSVNDKIEESPSGMS